MTIDESFILVALQNGHYTGFSPSYRIAESQWYGPPLSSSHNNKIVYTSKLFWDFALSIVTRAQPMRACRIHRKRFLRQEISKYRNPGAAKTRRTCPERLTDNDTTDRATTKFLDESGHYEKSIRTEENPDADN
ncbi:unnamed protein product [Haemonchus placei]|uniref:DDE_Tnp_1_7 domain-containing protein n=1 Tax=Haemonchus placei TaxID=6290 RepID=A0A0N4X5H5_HAEPC|nr:unnamed protein product [Haemonchus placei]